MADDKVECCKCNEKIASGTIVTALDKKWHTDCFKCAHCKEKISGKFNTPPGNTDPYCAECYNKLLAPKCKACNEPISNEKYVTYETDSYHKACFNCHICGDTLVDMSFILKDSKPACAKHA